MTPQFIMRCGLADKAREIQRETDRDLAEGIRQGHWNDPIYQYKRAEQEIEELDSYPNWFDESFDGKAVLTANWNNVSKRTYSLLEAYGFDCAWSDQVEGCKNCYRAVNNTPQCYGDMQVIKRIEDENGIVSLCPRCAVERFDEDVLPSLINNPSSADTLGMDLASYGFTRHNGEYENGFHAHQTDDPKAIMDSIHATRPELEVIFQIRDIGQFDVKFSAWTREPAKDEDEIVPNLNSCIREE
tara:strand:- start:5134 stop:5862 length:729 start_codon:yes stop_codon:yes gene_type:complete